MAITVVEKIESRELTSEKDKDTLKRVYLVYGTEDEYEVAALLPPINSKYMDRDLYVKSQNISWAKGGLNDCWYCEVIYDNDFSFSSNAPPNTASWELDLSGKTEKITNVTSRTYQVNFPTEADVGTAIGLNDNNVEGVDIYVPSGTLTISCTRKSKDITPEYVNNLIMITGSVNGVVYEGNWGSFAVGTLLFTGARLSRANKGLVETQYTFLISPNVTQQTITCYEMSGGGTITGTPLNYDKEGWWYLWLKYRDFPQIKAGETYDPATTPKLKLVSSFHIAKVYPYVDFNEYINLDGVRWLNEVVNTGTGLPQL